MRQRTGRGLAPFLHGEAERAGKAVGGNAVTKKQPSGGSQGVE